MSKHHNNIIVANGFVKFVCMYPQNFKVVICTAWLNTSTNYYSLICLGCRWINTYASLLKTYFSTGLIRLSNKFVTYLFIWICQLIMCDWPHSYHSPPGNSLWVSSLLSSIIPYSISVSSINLSCQPSLTILIPYLINWPQPDAHIDHRIKNRCGPFSRWA